MVSEDYVMENEVEVRLQWYAVLELLAGELLQ
jgi:hypothetical protein